MVGVTARCNMLTDAYRCNKQMQQQMQQAALPFKRDRL